MGYVIDQDIEVYRGDDWGPMVVQVLDQAVDVDGNPLWDDAGETIPTPGEPLDLTDATVVAQIRKSNKVSDTAVLGAFVATVMPQDDPETKGCISLEITHAVTAEIVANSAVYDVQVTNAAGKRRTYVRGKVTMDGDVSRD